MKITRICSILALGAFALSATFASALVVEPNAQQLNVQGSVVRYNGSSGVAIDPYWIITAKHCGFGSWTQVIMDGQVYQPVEWRPSPATSGMNTEDLDLALVRVDRRLPRWSRVTSRAVIDQEVALVGGWGLSRGTPMANGQGWNVAQASWQLLYGFNRVRPYTYNPFGGTAPYDISFRTIFSSPAGGSSDAAVPYEATASMNDSGGGLFVPNSRGEFEVAGIAISGGSQVIAPYNSGIITYRNLFSSRARDFIQSVNPSLLLPYCPADFNLNGTLSIDDLFMFLNAWFQQNPLADFNRINGVTIDDLFMFLSAWFAGCN